MTNVTLRKKPITKGRQSLYLDFYPAIKIPNSTKTTRREYLGLYILDKPKTEWDKQLNKEILQKADIIRVERMKSILNEQFGFLDKKKLDADFLKYFKKNCTESSISAYKHFNKFVEGKCTFRDIDVALCKRFKEYLLTAKQLNRKNATICQNTASSYYDRLKYTLKLAYKDKILTDKIDEHLSSIPTEETDIEYINLQELRQLRQTPCKQPVLKQAALLAATTGLRISDIEKLDWSEIRENSNGEYHIKFLSYKNKKRAILPLSEISIEILGEEGEGLIFKDLKISTLNDDLREWIATANITNKHITFHCLRHSFASILVELGVDIFIIKELLIHANIKNTLIYSKAENSKMREAVNKIKI